MNKYVTKSEKTSAAEINKGEKLSNIYHHSYYFHSFNYWDKSHIEKMLGFNVTIICCNEGDHYDFMSTYYTRKKGGGLKHGVE